MGIAALVLGIISALIAFIPFCNYFALIPAIIGVVLGIVDIVKKKKTGDKLGISIAGLVLSIIACVIIFVYTIIFGVIIAASSDNEIYDRAKDAKEEMDRLNKEEQKRLNEIESRYNGLYY